MYCLEVLASDCDIWNVKLGQESMLTAHYKFKDTETVNHLFFLAFYFSGCSEKV